MWELVLASVLMLAENGLSPLSLGGVSPEKVGLFNRETALYRLFGFEA